MPKGKPTEKQIRDVFNEFDADGSGGISSSEIKSILTRLGVKCTDDEVQGVIDAADIDGSGFIEYEEFKKAILN